MTFSTTAHDPVLRIAAGAAVERVLSDPDIRVVPQSRASFVAGLRLYNARRDKGYSLTDCISMETMRAEGIKLALTNDHHFEQEGFRPVFRAT